MNRKVKALMVLYGVKGVEIARKLGVSPDTVYVVVGGYGTSRRIKRAILRELQDRGAKVTYEELWGESEDKAA